MNRPVIGTVYGAVAGAGFGFVLASDIVMSRRHTK
jgi:enoyl-CoA hydratase/carnithine racemase